jgi:hypothetical protein
MEGDRWMIFTLQGSTWLNWRAGLMYQDSGVMEGQNGQIAMPSHRKVVAYDYCSAQWSARRTSTLIAGSRVLADQIVEAVSSWKLRREGESRLMSDVLRVFVM